MALAQHSCPRVPWWPRPLLDMGLGDVLAVAQQPLVPWPCLSSHCCTVQVPKGSDPRNSPCMGHGVRPRLLSPVPGDRHWLRAERTRQKPAVMSHHDDVTVMMSHNAPADFKRERQSLGARLWDLSKDNHTAITAIIHHSVPITAAVPAPAAPLLLPWQIVTAAVALGTATATQGPAGTTGTAAHTCPDSPPSPWVCHSPWSLPGFPGLPLSSSHSPEHARAPKLRNRAHSQTSTGWLTESTWKIRSVSHCQSCYPSSGAARTCHVALDSHKCVGCSYSPG